LNFFEPFFEGFLDTPKIIKFTQTMKVGIYARVSTQEQQTLPLQIKDLREFARRRKWKVEIEIPDVASGAKSRPKREELLKLARQRKIDCILVWRLDRFGRSLADLITTLDELNSLGVSFVSLNESLDLTTPSGKALAGMLAVFAEFERSILKERVKAGIAEARSKGKPHGRPRTASNKKEEAKKLYKNGKGMSKSEIARRLKIGRTSVIRLLSGT
jgi:DNA invertase Pin-like site-specific DNA recombinase